MSYFHSLSVSCTLVTQTQSYRCTAVQHRSDRRTTQRLLGGKLSQVRVAIIKRKKLSGGFVEHFRWGFFSSCIHPPILTSPHLLVSSTLTHLPLPQPGLVLCLSVSGCARLSVFALIYKLDNSKDAPLPAERSITCKEHLGIYRYLLFFW